ncbi:MAG: transcription-repair coupling factor [Victivallaceae bacterium]|nr:transcription-repair coupling factor [Victivallaceae bacterium]
MKKYLNDADSGRRSLVFVESDTLALPLARAVITAGTPSVAVLPDLEQAERAADEIKSIFNEVGLSPRLLEIPECGRGKLVFPEGESRRARALDALLQGQFDIAIGSVHAMLAPAPPPGETQDAALILKSGMELPLAELAQRLVTLDYDDEFEASVPGEFARRGGIIDIFSPAEEFPCRIEYFGDTIESLRSFSPKTHRSTGEVTQYHIIGRAGITAGGAASSDAFAYLKERSTRLICVHPAECSERMAKFDMPERAKRFTQILVENDPVLMLDSAESAGRHDLSASGVEPPLAAAPERDESSGSEQRAMRQRLFYERASAISAASGAIMLLADDPDDVPELSRWRDRMKFDPAHVICGASTLKMGFSLPEQKLYVLTSHELAGAGFIREKDAASEPVAIQVAPVPPQSPTQLPEFSFADLDENDYCVHIDHGIGIYRGLRTLSSGGISREVLVIEYADAQLLYVPLLQAAKVSRYLGSPGKLALHRLGAGRWKRDKEAARKGVHSYAADMLRLQALRQSISGIPYPADEAEERAFIRAFPFKDTPDQRRSTIEIAHDMESSRPMDRLLCGDVGYGKTELAMRAVFKAVNSGYQAAVLAPTTVLAQQHYYSFKERFAEYPFNIEMLSRFRTPGQQRDVLARLATGGVDVVIGTHRLCGSELKFKNLGLAVIDEEQRFGVKHKERLRRLRAEVDVLTMSATPIPRTLYMAMAGARDLSTLMTAPKQRMPVQTAIAQEDDPQVVKAMTAELARGGQIYYLHNRVKTIDECAKKIAEKIPAMRIGIAHGQMPEDELEEVMRAFLDRKIDCLICSTIIESGLDVPNANTIVIERADRFGLAELYQLRGRVGRWKRQAYAFLLLPRSQLVSTDARKRLAAIRRCSNLGAGFQLALHDLEIRGAGNILGAEQSGHLNTIGFELYCHLLKQEVAAMRGEKLEFLPDVDIGIDFVSMSYKAPAGELAAAFPPAYIGGERLRIDAYRRLSGLNTETELDDFADELSDRFGKLPEPACNLLEVTRLRILAARAGYEKLSVADGKVFLSRGGLNMYRKFGKIPFISYKNPLKLRMTLLLEILRDAAADSEDIDHDANEK